MKRQAQGYSNVRQLAKSNLPALNILPLGQFQNKSKTYRIIQDYWPLGLCDPSQNFIECPGQLPKVMLKLTHKMNLFFFLIQQTVQNENYGTQHRPSMSTKVHLPLYFVYSLCTQHYKVCLQGIPHSLVKLPRMIHKS